MTIKKLKILKCDQCKKTFETLRNLNDHRRKRHDEKNRIVGLLQFGYRGNELVFTSLPRSRTKLGAEAG